MQSYTRYNYEPAAPVSSLWKGTYYLDRVDNLERRFYGRALHTAARMLARVARR